MKTILQIILVIAFAAFADTLFAVGNLKVSILPVTAEKGFVYVSTLSKSNLGITVTDDKGEMLYSKGNIEPSDDFRSEFDFHELENGKYKVTAVGKDITTERLFRMTDKGIKIGKEKTYLKPYFGYKDGILKYTFLNFQKENLIVNLLNKNQLLYDKEIGYNFIVSEGLDLSNLENGTYEVVLSVGDKEYSYKINKQ
jgi:hypothetical protein